MKQSPENISYPAALDIVLAQPFPQCTVSVPIEYAIGRTLAIDIYADRDFPPFDRVAMDGIAIQYDRFNAGQRNFVIQSIAPAGKPLTTLTNQDHAVEVMTGAMLPKGTDTVIRYEDVHISDGIATILVDHLTPGHNIHKQGHDLKYNELIVHQGSPITVPIVSVLATIGYRFVPVRKCPKVLIVATGDELVPLETQPLPHQIRMSNAYMVQAALTEMYITADIIHLSDDYDDMYHTLTKEILYYDCIVLSGAVSMGKYDYLPKVLDQLGVQRLFHRVMQRPGKPFWFGVKSTCTIFAFPGNPLSTFVCTKAYLLPWINKLMNRSCKNEYYAIAEDFSFEPDLTLFLECKLIKNEHNETVAMPHRGNGSGDIVNMSSIDGFLILPQTLSFFEKGSHFPFIPI